MTEEVTRLGRRRCKSAICTRQISGPVTQRARLLSAKDIRSSLRVTERILHRPRYAYFTMLLTDDNLPSALSLGWSLKKSGTENDLVIMVTNAIGKKSRTFLKRVFDRVTEVDAITASRAKYVALPEKERKSVCQKMTKANIFKFIEYEKAIFIDCSVYVLRNIDGLFKLDPPAGISSLVDSVSQDKCHGMRLSKDHVKRALQVACGIRGTMMLLKPKLTLYHYCHAFSGGLKETYFIRPDAEFFTKLFHNQWTHIHAKYASVMWQACKLKPETVCGVSYESLQPWKDDCREFEDIIQWRTLAVKMCVEIPYFKSVYCNTKWFNDAETAMRQTISEYDESCPSTDDSFPPTYSDVKIERHKFTTLPPQV